MSRNDSEKRVHQWEFNGLGKAPFRVVGLFSFPSPSLAEANPTAYQNAMREAPKGFDLGSCGACGHALVNNFLIRSADGQQFSVGSDCVEKTGDKGMVDQVKALEKKARQEARMDAKRQKYEAVQQTLDEQRQRNGGRTNEECFRDCLRQTKGEIFQEAQDRLDLLADRLTDGKGSFCDSIADDLRGGRLPKGRGLTLVLEILAKQKGRKGSAAYIEEHDRLTRELDNLAGKLCEAESLWRNKETELIQEWQNGQWEPILDEPGEEDFFSPR